MVDRKIKEKFIYQIAQQFLLALLFFLYYLIFNSVFYYHSDL